MVTNGSDGSDLLALFSW